MLVAYRPGAYIRTIPIDRIKTSPAGWRPPYLYSTLDNPTKRRHPATRVKAMAYMDDGCGLPLNAVRKVPELIEAQLANLDNQIRSLRETKAKLLEEYFPTFLLLQVGDADIISQGYRKVYPTKAQAEKAAP